MEEFPSLARMLQLILFGFCLFLIVFGAFILVFSDILFDLPRVEIDPATPAGPPIKVSRSFSFHNTSGSVSIAVNASVYAASKKSYRGVILVRNPEGYGNKYYNAIMNDPTQEAIYDDLLVQFRAIRNEHNLSDDDYLEMMTSFVQTIPYKDGGNAPPKYPAELLVENMGDCDDKAMLLSGLLAREGYTVSLFKFGPESHMAMGIGSDAFPYKATGYTYLEAMTPAYAGIPTFSIMTKKPLNSDPMVIPISNGTRVYGSGGMTAYINETMARTKAGSAALTARLDAFPETGKESAEYLAVQEERDRYAAIHQYIMNHPLDRPGTYAYLQREWGENTG
ncbi:MAG TPA: hypothetical protein HA272_10975 [Methanoregula sp.]|nr:hypothetical protein [Methanoregula sp.]